MGISTVQSYRGAQIFEAIGLNQAFVDEYFTWTPSRIGGIGLDVIARGDPGSATTRAFPERPLPSDSLDPGGQYQYRDERRVPPVQPAQTIHKLQHACRTGNYERFKEYSRLVDDQSKTLCTLRGLMELKPDRARRCRSRKSNRSRRS